MFSGEICKSLKNTILYRTSSVTTSDLDKDVNCDTLTCHGVTFPSDLYEKETPIAQVFCCEYCKIFKNNFFL